MNSMMPMHIQELYYWALVIKWPIQISEYTAHPLSITIEIIPPDNVKYYRTYTRMLTPTV